MTSVALPPLGTGGGSIPIERMCKMLINTLREFGMTSTTLTEVTVVIFEKEKLASFLLKLKEIVEQTKRETGLIRLMTRKCKVKTPVKDQRTSSVVDRELPGVPSLQVPELAQAVDKPVQQMILCNVDTKSEEAQVTVYSLSRENRTGAFEQIVGLCEQHIISKSFLNKKIKHFKRSKLLMLRDFLKDMNMNIVVHPGTEKVEVAGLKSDVDGLESYLSDMVDNLAE